MFGSMVIDVAIGLALVYFFLGIICSAVSEAISNFLSLRAKTLETGIERLLGSPDLAKRVYANPLIRGLAKNDSSAPSYIPAEIFAVVLIEELTKEVKKLPPEVSTMQMAAARDAVAAFEADRAARPKVQLTELLRAAAAMGNLSGTLPIVLANTAITDIEKAKHAIAVWFDKGMERSSGWYKRRTQHVIILVALGVTLTLNVDSFRIARAISQNATLRESIVASYTNAAKVNAPGPEVAASPAARALQIQRELGQLHLPIGWEVWPPDKGFTVVSAIMASVPGWLVTAMAASLGAPFWFDLLNKLVNLRMGGKPPQAPKQEAEKKEPEKKEAEKEAA